MQEAFYFSGEAGPVNCWLPVGFCFNVPCGTDPLKQVWGNALDLLTKEGLFLLFRFTCSLFSVFFHFFKVFFFFLIPFMRQLLYTISCY